LNLHWGSEEMSFQMDRHDALANSTMVENRSLAEMSKLLGEEFL
jgi:hypothetical protein